MNQTLSPHALRVSDLAQNTATEFLVILKDADLRARAEEIAARLGLGFEYRFTGYGDLAVTLENWANR